MSAGLLEGVETAILLRDARAVDLRRSLRAGGRKVAFRTPESRMDAPRTPPEVSALRARRAAAHRAAQAVLPIAPEIDTSARRQAAPSAGIACHGVTRHLQGAPGHSVDGDATPASEAPQNAAQAVLRKASESAMQAQRQGGPATHCTIRAPSGLHSAMHATTAGRKFPAIAFRSRNVLAWAAIWTWASSENDSGLTRCPPVSAGGTP